MNFLGKIARMKKNKSVAKVITTTNIHAGRRSRGTRYRTIRDAMTETLISLFPSTPKNGNTAHWSKYARDKALWEKIVNKMEKEKANIPDDWQEAENNDFDNENQQQQNSNSQNSTPPPSPHPHHHPHLTEHNPHLHVNPHDTKTQMTRKIEIKIKIDVAGTMKIETRAKIPKNN